MKQVTQLDFSGQKIFAGIDVHKKSWKVSIRSEQMELKTFSQNPSANELSTYLKLNYPLADYHVVYEAGFCGFSHQRAFDQAGINCIVVNAADVPTTGKEKQRKSDVVDCRKLGQALSKGQLTGIFIPCIEQQDDRDIIRTYNQMVKDQTRYKNRIRGWLHFQGITFGESESRYWSNVFTHWLKELPLSPSARTALDLKLQGYQQARGMVLAATRQVRALSKQERYKKRITLIRTVPGVGEITALLFVTEVGDINRFKSFDALCDYVGLVPNTHSTGDKENVSGLTRRANHQLRERLIETSWTAVRTDPAMTMAFNNYCKRMKKNNAIIRIAKKVLNRIRYVMKNEAPYVIAVVK